MLMVSYKLLDGGIMAAQADRIREDRKANDFRLLDEKEGIELNLRALLSGSLRQSHQGERGDFRGTATAQKANTLYLEQFQGGQNAPCSRCWTAEWSCFTMQKNTVNGKYEQLRAGYGNPAQTWDDWSKTAVQSPAR